MAKNTSGNKRVFYQPQTIYRLKKHGAEWQLCAELNPWYHEANYVGIFINNSRYDDEFITCSGPYDSTAGFCLYNRVSSTLSDTLKYFGLLGISRYELIVTDHDHHLKNTLLRVAVDSVFRLASPKEMELNAGVINDFPARHVQLLRQLFYQHLPALR